MDVSDFLIGLVDVIGVRESLITHDTFAAHYRLAGCSGLVVVDRLLISYI